MIVPTFRCRDVTRTIRFYTGILDFTAILALPHYAVLIRDGAELHLEAGDAPSRQVAAVLVDDPDALFTTFRARGLIPPIDRTSPVHQGPLDQTWGTREFYIDDPDGNTLRFIRR